MRALAKFKCAGWPNEMRFYNFGEREEIYKNFEMVKFLEKYPREIESNLILIDIDKPIHQEKTSSINEIIEIEQTKWYKKLKDNLNFFVEKLKPIFG